MKKRLLVSVYLLTWFTSAFYFLFWIFYIMRDLNVILGNIVFDLKKKLMSFSSIIIPYTTIFCFLSINIENNTINQSIIMIAFLINFILAILWFVVIVRTLRQVSTCIAKVEIDNRLDKPITKGKTTLFFFLYFMAIPYIQYHMNKIIDVYNQKAVCKKRYMQL